MSDQETGRPDYLDDDEEDGRPLLPPAPKEASGRPADRAIPLPPSSLPPDEKEEAEKAGDGGTAPVYPFPTASPPKEPPRAGSPPRRAEEPYAEGFFDQEDDGDPFDLPGAEKMGIIGGRQVGKSFLFQAMTYRTYSKAQAGVMSSFVDNTALYYALQRNQKARRFLLTEFCNKYISWQRLPFTSEDNQQWYRLRLYYKTGILGRTPSFMDVEYFDGSGENFFEATRTRGISQMWRAGYLDARVMVFCLPLWAAFPGSKMTPDDWAERNLILQGFDKVVQNYEELRRVEKRSHPVRSILAFTMADDPRNALGTLYDRWIAPYMDKPGAYLRKLAKESGIARYLANARTVSEALHQELIDCDPRVSSIPQRLDFGSRPWLLPVSAVDGKLLDRIEKGKAQTGQRPAPVPVHAELPLLVALCERHNALM